MNAKSHKTNIIIFFCIAVLWGLTNFDGIGKTQKLPVLFYTESVYFNYQKEVLSCRYTSAVAHIKYQPLFEQWLRKRQQCFGECWFDEKIGYELLTLKEKSVLIQTQPLFFRKYQSLPCNREDLLDIG